MDWRVRHGRGHGHERLAAAQAVQEKAAQFVPLAFEDQRSRLGKAPKFAHLFAAAVDDAELVQLSLGGREVKSEFNVEILLRSGGRRGGRLGPRRSDLSLATVAIRQGWMACLPPTTAACRPSIAKQQATTANQPRPCCIAPLLRYVCSVRRPRREPPARLYLIVAHEGRLSQGVFHDPNDLDRILATEGTEAAGAPMLRPPLSVAIPAGPCKTTVSPTQDYMADDARFRWIKSEI